MILPLQYLGVADTLVYKVNAKYKVAVEPHGLRYTTPKSEA